MFLFWSRTLISLFFSFLFLFVSLSLKLEVCPCIYCSFLFFSFSQFGCPLPFNNWTTDHYSMHLFGKFQTILLLLKRVKGRSFAYAWSKIKKKKTHFIPWVRTGSPGERGGHRWWRQLKGQIGRWDPASHSSQPWRSAFSGFYYISFLQKAYYLVSNF